MEINRKCTAFWSGFLLLALAASGMQQPPARDQSDQTIVSYQEVWSNQKLRQEFEKHKFAVIGMVVTKNNSKLAGLLDSCSEKVAIALADQGYQHVQYAHSAESINLNPTPDLTPIIEEIVPFYKKLTSDQQDDLDCITPLGLTVFLNDEQMCITLLKHKANINRALGMRGLSPLHLAAKHNPSFIRLLLQRGANIELPIGLAGYTPLMVACQEDGRIEAVRLLLDAGAKSSAKSSFQDPNGTLYTLTALHFTCNAKQHEKIKVLLNRENAPVNEPDNNGRTALHSTATNNDARALTILLDRGADCSIRSVDLTYAIEELNPTYDPANAMLLLCHGSPLPISRAHRNLVTRGIEQRCTFIKSNIVKLLLSALITDDTPQFKELVKASVANELNQTDPHRMTPLHWAVCRGNIEAVRTLLSANKEFSLWAEAKSVVSTGQQRGLVDVNAEDKDGRTPLMWAGRLGRCDIFDALLLAKAHLHARDNLGQTFADHAIACGHRDKFAGVISTL